MNPTPPTNNPWNAVTELVIQLLAKVGSIDSETVRKYIEIPPDPNLGDIASTVSFQLAKQQKKNPAAIATEIAQSLEKEVMKEPMLDRVETRGPYVNFFFDRGEFARLAVNAVSKLDDRYGMTEEFKGTRALIESPAVNPSKPWHIGHARNAILGDTLANILEAVGYEVMRIDYINDLGLQIAQLTWKIMHDDVDLAAVSEKMDLFLGHLYVEVQKAAENDTGVENEIREITRRLEDLNSEEAKRSAEMVTLCLKAQCQTAYRLGIYKNYQIWESSIAHSGLLQTAKDLMLQAENITTLTEGEKKGCIVANLASIEEFKDMKDPHKVLFRSDGTRTYTGADVAFQMWKFGIIKDPFHYGVFEKQANGEDVYRTALDGSDRNLGKFNAVYNLIGSAQAHPQRLIYTILDLLGYSEQSLNSHHVAYEFVGLEDADFSGREGTWIGYSTDDVLDKAVELAKEEVAKRNPDESDKFKETVGAKVGTGAVRYFMLNASPDRKITFRWKEALDFNGDAAPYLQYSFARAQRILEKNEMEPAAVAELALLSSEHEFALVKAIARFPEEILEVVRGLKKDLWGTSFSSNRIAGYCYELATLFSKFYDSCPVLKAEPATKAARLQLVTAFKITMGNCLRVLGIPIVERM
ncbi:MAG: arginine--tRNA ligase [Candidatus Thorarchaeota archaeon]